MTSQTKCAIHFSTDFGTPPERQTNLAIQQRDARIAALEHRKDSIEWVTAYIDFELSTEMFQMLRDSLPTINGITLISTDGKRFVFSPFKGLGFSEVEPGRMHGTYDYDAPQELLGQPIGILNSIETLEWNYKVPRQIKRLNYQKVEFRLSANDVGLVAVPIIQTLARTDGVITLDVKNEFRNIEEDYVRAQNQARKLRE